MKKRLFLYLMLCITAVTTAWAEPINASQAKALARQFMLNHAMPSTNLELVSRSASLNGSLPGQAAYYVFNNDRMNGGYIIVSGDDRTPAVLAYSDKGTFDANEVPEAMQALLDSYVEQIAALDAGAMLASHMTPAPAISPMVPSMWSQNSPYNILFPMVTSSAHAKVGCVATAMAQVLYYHKWPVRTTQPIPAYTSTALSIYMPELPVVDFEWDLMQDTYLISDSTSAQALAASLLSLYCAQSVEMNFKSSSSGATTTRVPLALSNYFGYSAGMHSLRRSNYTTAEWESAIYSELAAARPVIYSGSKESSGHAYVCDGYDGDCRFHINWGWNGMSNGYFLLNVLNPDLQGTGSANGDYGYVYRQAIVVGIEPDYGATNEFGLTISDLALNSFTGTRSSSSGNFTAVVSGHFNNYTSQYIDADLGWALYQGDTLVKRLISSYTTSLRPGSYINHANKELSFGSGLTSGTYRIVPIFSERSAGNWRPCIGADMNYIEVTINNNRCTFTGYGTAGTPDYTVNNIAVTGNMHPNRPVDIVLNMTNNGYSFNELLYMFVDGAFTSASYVCIEQGETDDIPFSYLPEEAGSYTVKFSFNEDGSNPIATRTLTIVNMPSADLTGSIKVFEVTDSINRIITSDKFSGRLTITNNGSTTYNEDIAIRLYKNIYGNYGSNIQTITQLVNLAPGASTTIEFDLDDVMDNWRYFVKTFYYSSGGEEPLASSGFYTIVFPEVPPFTRGDVNGDGSVSIKDVTDLINYLLTGDETGMDLQAVDCNEDGELGIKDITDLINFLLTGYWN